MAEIIEFDPVDTLSAGAFGIPGDRTFLIQARKGSAHGYYRHASGKVVLAIGRHNSEIWHDTRVPRLDDFAMKPTDKPARVPANDPRKLSI